MRIRVPVTKKVFRSSLRIVGSYKCPDCGKENHFYHDLTAETNVFGDAEGRNRKTIENQLKRLSNNKNPNIYPQAKISHSCQHCGKVPAWAAFNFSKDIERIGTCGVIAMGVCVLLAFITNGEPLWPLSVPYLLPILYSIKTLAKWIKCKNRLKELREEDFPIFRVPLKK